VHNIKMEIHVYPCLLCRDSGRDNSTVQFCRFKGTLAPDTAQSVKSQRHRLNEQGIGVRLPTEGRIFFQTSGAYTASSIISIERFLLQWQGCPGVKLTTYHLKQGLT